MEENKIIEKKEQRKIILNILVSIDDFCRTNDINYSLTAGTLLGAVRHKGFIPWDDDIDIMMTRDNYEKFRTKYKSKKYPLVDLKNDLSHPVPMAKIYDSSTYFFYRKTIRRKYGLFVDVFPIDIVPTDREERVKWLKSIRRFISYNSIKNNAFSFIINNKSSILWIVKSILIKFLLNRKFIHNHLECLFQKYRNYKSDLLGCACGETKDGDIFLYQKSFFDEYVCLDFEGHQLQSVKEYDSFLKILYGNYMKLPPKEQQVGKHGIIAYYK